MTTHAMTRRALLAVSPAAAAMVAVQVAEEAVGLPALHRCGAEIDARLDEIDRAIIDMPGSLATPALLAAKVMLRHSMAAVAGEGGGSDMDALRSALRSLRPSIGGRLGHDIDKLLKVRG